MFVLCPFSLWWDYKRNANSSTEAESGNILLVYNYQFFSRLVLNVPLKIVQTFKMGIKCWFQIYVQKDHQIWCLSTLCDTIEIVDTFVGFFFPKKSSEQ